MLQHEKNEKFFYFVGGIFPVMGIDAINRFYAFIDSTSIHVNFLQSIEVAQKAEVTRIKTMDNKPIIQKVLCWYVGCYCTEKYFKSFFGLADPYGKSTQVQKHIEKGMLEFHNIKDVYQ